MAPRRSLAEISATLVERYACPYRDGDGTMLPTVQTLTDSGGTTVRVWKCSTCGYTEGHIDPASPSAAYAEYLAAIGGR